MLCSSVEIGLSENIIVNPVYFTFAALAGWNMTKSFALLIMKNTILKNFFVYMGQKSIWILCMHHVVFKIVAVIECLCFKLNITNIAKFPVVSGSGIWWIAYSFVGIMIPLIVAYFYDLLMTFMKDKNYRLHYSRT